MVALVGAAEVDREGLVRLELGVAVDQDGDGLARLARGEGHRAGGALIVVVRQRRRAVGGGEVDGDRLRAGVRQAHREDEGGRAGVAFQQA